jgi:hypothetical protein
MHAAPSPARTLKAAPKRSLDSRRARRRRGDPRVCSWAAILCNTARIGGYDTWLTQQIDLAGAIAGVD